jgi:putative nucleotidyltransferase with HDIG domain
VKGQNGGASATGNGSERRSAARPPSWLRGLRRAVRSAADRVLAADALWSAAFVGVTATMLASQRCAGGYPQLIAGVPAPFTVRAFEDVEVPDLVATTARSQEARATVPDVFVHDTQKAAALEKSFTADLAGVGPLPDAERQLAIGWLREVMQGLVIANKPLLAREKSITVVHMPGSREEVLHEFSSVSDLEAARNELRRRIATLGSLAPSTRARLADLAAGYVDANLTEDVRTTADRRDQAERGSLPVQVRIAKGTILAARGETVTPETIARIAAIESRSAPRTGILGFAALLALCGALAFFLHRYCVYHQRAFKRVRHLHALIVLVLLTTILLAEGIQWLAHEVAPHFRPPFNDPSSYVFLVPVAAGAILIALLANGRIAMIYATFAGVLYGAQNGWDLPITVWALLTQWAGVYAITSYRERAALLRAGFVVGGAGALCTLAVAAAAHAHDPWPGALYGASLALVGGAVGVGLLVSFALPMLEDLFRVLTDIRLLELSSVSNPLLSQLAVKAPGSYNHSLVVGTLAEEAARAIGANALFCRVAAFYHDIGKIRKPEYYIENQRGVNPHERLQPSMSALIVASHVKDGIRMARDARLPEQIVDIIPQHHGTRLMSYFFEKAKKQAAATGSEANDADFRYPGPKPQTKEAAIYMLADGVEAAARTLDEPSPSRLRELVHQIASRIVLDAQLDQCDLTFADLERIEEAFHRTLVSMYHHRVDYPGYDFSKPKGERPGGEVRPFRSGA